ncbi:MAG: TonB-dependent receptor [Novosphingobium sp.]|nr:TonB-dependent receptor [Novosphingobium sp.]
MKHLFLLSSVLFSAAPALAQAGSAAPDIVLGSYRVPDEAITVVATGSDIRVEESGQSISVVGLEEIASVQGADIARVLERLPGVSLVRNGTLGGTTSMFVRGANSQQLLVMVDGVRVADVAAPSGGYDFANLATGGIGKIELLRGSNSVIWGSDAIGGVLAVTSRQLEGVEASAEYGARDTFNGQANAGLLGDGYDLTVGGGYTNTDGVSSADAGSETDGFRQWRVGGRGQVSLAPNLYANASARYADGKLDIDGYVEDPPGSFNYVFADTPEFQKTREMSARGGLRYSGPSLLLDAAYALADTRRRYFDPRFGSDPNFVTKGRSERADLRGAWDATNDLRIDFGADSEWTRFETTYEARKSARLSSAHALLGWRSGALNVAAGVRVDDHSRFGSEWTFGANGSFEVAPSWRIRASYGEGFKAPTLYQLFSEYGDPALSPERSKSYDFGIERGERNGFFHVALTAFRRDTRGLIDYVSCFSVSDPLCDDGRFGFYANVGKARAQGVEFELGARVSDRVHAQAAYTYLEATDRTPGGFNRGNDLARRPRHAVSVTVDWETPLAGLSLGGDIRMVSDSYDDAGNFSRIDGHALGTIRASLPVNDSFELYGRIENITDENYETTAGYGTPGRSAYVGARARF